MSASQTMMSNEIIRARRRETILVVEDDEPLLKLLRFFLADEGYTVL